MVHSVPKHALKIAMVDVNQTKGFVLAVLVDHIDLWIEMFNNDSSHKH